MCATLWRLWVMEVAGMIVVMVWVVDVDGVVASSLFKTCGDVGKEEDGGGVADDSISCILCCVGRSCNVGNCDGMLVEYFIKSDDRLFDVFSGTFCVISRVSVILVSRSLVSLTGRLLLLLLG